MNILIAGGTGLIGSALITALKPAHRLTIISRTPERAKLKYSDLQCIGWEEQTLASAFEHCDVVINLVGENIGKRRWSNTVKEAIIHSRVQATQTLVMHCQNSTSSPRLMNASAIGIYGLQPTIEAQATTVYNETSPLPNPANDFLSSVGQAWEAPLNESEGISIVKLRFGVVLSPNGGMLKQLLLPFKLGLGGRVGSGDQLLSWIAIEDVVSIISYLLSRPNLEGSFNLVAPEVVSQLQFAKTLASALSRPCIAPLPSFIVKLFFGQMGEELLLSGQNVQTTRLSEFPFKYRNLKQLLLSTML